MHWHAFFQNAYSGGGFTLGAGFTQFVSPNNTLDVRGSITPSGYKRLEAEFIAPGLVRAPRDAERDRRLAGGHSSRLLRIRDDIDSGRENELQLPAALRVHNA
jgi:hypothetical protein